MRSGNKPTKLDQKAATPSRSTRSSVIRTLPRFSQTLFTMYKNPSKV
jgi:hypothetical protein